MDVNERFISAIDMRDDVLEAIEALADLDNADVTAHPVGNLA